MYVGCATWAVGAANDGLLQQVPGGNLARYAAKLTAAEVNSSIHRAHRPMPAERVRAANPAALVISEMGPPDFRALTDWGHDAMWIDSLHHALHVALTGERDGYYAEFDGSMASIAAEQRRPEGVRIVAAAQNHDQVGNRALGDRLAEPKRRLAAAVVLLSTFTPLLFQGEEYGERAPFLVLADHVDPYIADATREGRRREFRGFAGFRGEVPDPQDAETFERSKLTLRRGRATLRVDFARETVSLDA